MKLSIIVPAFNAEKTIHQCLDSILAQTVPEFELIVINDGSADSTEEILKDYLSRYPGLLRFQTVENGGQGRARNIALDIAKGDYIGFVDSDDWVERDMFPKLLLLAESEDCDIVHCDVTSHFPDGSTAAEKVYRPNCPIASAGFANNMVFRRRLLESIRFPEDKLWYEDTEFTARCIHRAKKEAHLNESLYHYRRGLPSTMNNQNAMKNLDILTVMEHLEDEFLPDDRDDFEFLVINHVLLDAMNRVQSMDVPEKKDVLWLMRAYVHERIPHLKQSESYRKESRNRRIIMMMHYTGLSGLAEFILNMKNGRN